MHKRILIKLSGEALAGDGGKGFNHKIVIEVAQQLKQLVEENIQVSVVIGGGNFWRGRSSSDMDRTKADQIGMLATVMNAIYVANVCRSEGIGTVVQTPFVVGTMTELFSKDKALEHLAQNKVVFFAGGTGHPFFSTDTGAVLRAAEIEVDALFFAKNIDGIYDSDPKLNKNAIRHDRISFKEIIAQNLKAMDLTAATLCNEQKLQIIVFSLEPYNAILKAVHGEIAGTTIYPD
ncbi:UMP kinase [Candidatus Epulonipiscium fishelsonii]|uniref:UMP kinase n=1 Tax=Candidatus Epulonipiscium fishelsonii TaxID=77094 RepID=A0ACC8XED8_9FIRM|nr:UMP kinase [Epulopiscium sp. SCG-D08WGA-EpuloA1]